MEKIPVIVVLGPTASGKTALAIELARAYNGEIVSADSMQIYKGMDIATAKPTPYELSLVSHHLIGFVEPDERFSVADYVKEAQRVICDINSRGRQAILCGGTGLYINSLIDNIRFDDTHEDFELRERYLKIAEEKGNHYLWEQLKSVDEQAALNIHENNLTRVIRALEVYELSGKTISQAKAESRLEPSPYRAYFIGLKFSDRQMLYDRINNRVDKMVEMGLVEEARNAYLKSGSMVTAQQAIGYKELIPYFQGRSSLSECIEKIKRETRRYAKRQLTWFRRDSRINWVDCDKFVDIKKISEKIQKDIAKSDFL
ncbi:MAG: tRNA (adenosine(37)-N6)-dimethylallyltransferase MiaA [Ruminococcus sp.]|nr:tRNA (adenosine(37)-N6)-dimethylallyltransferase MiaA [Ruminococcus sp.]